MHKSDRRYAQALLIRFVHTRDVCDFMSSIRSHPDGACKNRGFSPSFFYQISQITLDTVTITDKTGELLFAHVAESG